jgi:hypothetical protein
MKAWTFHDGRVAFRMGDEEGTLFVEIPDQVAADLDAHVGRAFPVFTHDERYVRARLNRDFSVSML